MPSTNPVTVATTNVVRVTGSDNGDYFLHLRFTVEAGTGTSQLAAGIYEATLPANGINLRKVS